jgi:asparagine synthase (glutamine-hydrolysing)
MVESLVHRGPDHGVAVARAGTALGMRRLAIVDVEGGRQPFTNENRTVWVVANGEIYNFEALKQTLSGLGHRFHTRSDIEVIPHAYEQWGEGFASRLHGMFAIALWDEAERTLVLARDRAGEKPLYYAVTAQGLVAASEIKAILRGPRVDRQLDTEALEQFLTFEYVLTPRTIFAGIRRLPPAHYLVYRGGQLRLVRYWDPAAIPVRRWREEEAVEAIRAELARAVDSQMMSDVPLGVFLSGGIDSSAVVAFMARAAERRGATVNSFSMGFEDGSYNELPHARLVARHFATNHREGLVQPSIEALFDRLVLHFDEPFADVSLFPTYMVSELARRHVTVALSGDGGDELFGGYDSYRAQALASQLERVAPAGAIRALDRLVGHLRPSELKRGAVNKLKRFLGGAARAPRHLEHYRWMTFLDPHSRARLFTPSLRATLASSDVYRPIRDALGARATDDPLTRQLFTDLTVYLSDDILVKVDRMSMATSLETRAPLLDVGVMELVLSMPSRFKIRHGQRKWILKRALRGLLPESILRRSKEGFSIPMKQWLKRELRPVMLDLLTPDSVRRRGLFEPAEVERLVTEHTAGVENHAHLLFCLMVFERWAREFLDRGPEAQSGAATGVARPA